MEVEFWQGAKDEIPPVILFIQRLPAKTQAKIWKRGIDFLMSDGTLLLATQNKLFRKMSGHQFYELRIFYDKTYYRIFVVLHYSTAWLVHAIVKKTDKTPDKDIRIVEERIRIIKSIKP